MHFLTQLGGGTSGDRAAGSIEVGKWADLVLLDANPIADIGHTTRISGVVMRGRWLSRGTLGGELARIARRIQSQSTR